MRSDVLYGKWLPGYSCVTDDGKAHLGCTQIAPLYCGMTLEEVHNIGGEFIACTV